MIETTKRRIIIEIEDYENDTFTPSDLDIIKHDIEELLQENYNLIVTGIKVENVND